MHSTATHLGPLPISPAKFAYYANQNKPPRPLGPVPPLAVSGMLQVVCDRLTPASLGQLYLVLRVVLPCCSGASSPAALLPCLARQPAGRNMPPSTNLSLPGLPGLVSISCSYSARRLPPTTHRGRPAAPVAITSPVATRPPPAHRPALHKTQHTLHDECHLAACFALRAGGYLRVPTAHAS